MTSDKRVGKCDYRWKTSKTLPKDGGGKLVGQSMKNLQTLWRTGREKSKDLGD